MWCLSLKSEHQQDSEEDLSESVRLDRQEIVLQRIESNIDYDTADDPIDDAREEPGGTRKAPKNVSLLDAQDEHPMIVRSSQVLSVS